MPWMMRSVGATTGAAISFAVNINQTKAGGVSSTVYIVFIVIQCSSLLLSAFLLIDPKDVIRDDGTHLAIFKPPILKQEMKALGQCFVDKRFIILLPAMLVCEMALALVSTINGKHSLKSVSDTELTGIGGFFNLRTRGLNNLCFQVIQFFGPGVLIWIFDSKLVSSRKTRGMIGVGLMALISISACAGLYGWLHWVKYSSLKQSPAADWTSKYYASWMVIYLLFGIIYSGYQMTTEWIIASMSNDPSVLAQYAGFFRGMASFGMCVSFVMAAQKVPQYGQLALQLM